MGVDQGKLKIVLMEKTYQLDLPEDYTVVPAVVLQKEKASMPESQYGSMQP